MWVFNWLFRTGVPVSKTEGSTLSVFLVTFVVLAGFTLFGVMATKSDNKKAATKKAVVEERSKDLRFVKVDSFVFEPSGNPNYDKKAAVYKDTETGIKYMYVWMGGYRGGPMITRLWEK